MSPSVHNGETFSAGDEMVISSDGGTYRSYFTVPSAGSSGTPITYTFDSAVKICGADLFDSGWTVYSGSVYQVAATTEVTDLYYDGEWGTLQASAGACTSNGDWYWASNVLYLYSSGGNPGTVYTSPGVEGSVRDHCFRCDQSYVTIDGNGAELYYGQGQGLFIYNNNQITGINVDNLRCHHTKTPWGQPVHIVNCLNSNFTRIEAYESGTDGNAFQITVWAYDETTFGNILVEDCSFHDSHHSAFDLIMLTGRSPLANVTVRRCRGYDSRHQGFMFLNANTGPGYEASEIYFYDNQSYNNGRVGICFQGDYFDDCVIVNNTSYGNGTDNVTSNWGPGIQAECRGAIIKNNVCAENNINTSGDIQISVSDGGGTPNDVDYNLAYSSSGSTVYEEDSTGYTHAAYQSFGQQVNAPTPADPLFTDPENGDFTRQSGSPCIGAAVNLGAPYNVGTLPGSTWPDGVLTGDRDDY